MKKIIVAFLVLCIASYAFSGTFGTSGTYSETREIISGSANLGTGSTVYLEKPMSRFTCTVNWGGSTPTNTVVNLEGSIDNATWGTLANVTVLSSGTMFHVADKPVIYYRGNYVSKSGGAANTTVTMKCQAMQ